MHKVQNGEKSPRLMPTAEEQQRKLMPKAEERRDADRMFVPRLEEPAGSGGSVDTSAAIVAASSSSGDSSGGRCILQNSSLREQKCAEGGANASREDSKEHPRGEREEKGQGRSRVKTDTIGLARRKL